MNRNRTILTRPYIIRNVSGIKRFNYVKKQKIYEGNWKSVTDISPKNREFNAISYFNEIFSIFFHWFLSILSAISRPISEISLLQFLYFIGLQIIYFFLIFYFRPPYFT